MLCHQCKRKLEDTAKFCRYCGSHVEITPQMVEAAAHGNLQAQTDLIRYTQDDMRHAVLNKLGYDWYGQMAYEEVMQEGYCKMVLNLSTIKEPGAFRDWLHEVMIKTAIDYQRKTGRRMATFESLEAKQEKENFQKDTEDVRVTSIPDIMYEKSEAARLLNLIFKDMPENNRVVMLMHYDEGMTFQAISEVLGAPVSTIKTRCASGKKFLEKKMVELKKQGVELYSLSPITFVLVLLRSQDLGSSQAAQAMMKAVTAKLAAGGGTAAAGAEIGGGAAAGGSAASASSAAAGAAGSAAAGGTAATAGAGGTAAFTIPAKVVAVRVAIGVAAAAVVGGGGYAVHEVREQRIEQEAQEAQAVQNEAAVSAAEDAREETRLSPVPTSQAIPTSTPAPTPTQGPPPITDSEDVVRNNLNNSMAPIVSTAMVVYGGAASENSNLTEYTISSQGDMAGGALWWANYADPISFDQEGEYERVSKERCEELAYALFDDFSGDLDDVNLVYVMIDRASNGDLMFGIGDPGVDSFSWPSLERFEISDGVVVAYFRETNSQKYEKYDCKITFRKNTSENPAYPYTIQKIERY